MHLIRVSCLLATVLTAGLLQALPLDLAPNGSFEDDRNRDGHPDGWQPALFDSPGVATWDKTVAHSGTASVCLADSAHPTDTGNWRANTARWVLRPERTVKPGQRVTATGWIKTDLTAGEAKIVLAWFSDDKWLHEDGSPAATGVTDWTLQTVTANAPDQATRMSVYLSLSGGKGKAWFDDIQAFSGTKAPQNFRPVDLTRACTTGFRDETAGDRQGGWTDQGDNDARTIPTGAQTFRTIPFTIINPDQNGGRSCIVLAGKGRKDVPKSATFDVGQTSDVLYFLHGAAWAGTPGTIVAEYAVKYDDGETQRVPVRNGFEVTDWWGPADADACAAGWEGANAKSDHIGLVIFPWLNPKPGVRIASVTAETTGDGPNLMLAAVTAGDGSPVFPEVPLNYQFTDTTGWYEWTFDNNNPALGELDLSRRLDAPAGKHGFIKVSSDGHFSFDDGTRIRFFGTNVGGAQCCPEKEQAEIQAQRLAAYGVNLLRLHTPDSRWAPLIDYAKKDSQSLNPDALDRMDYFVAELKKRGIYVYFDLLDYRSFLPADGVRDAEKMETGWKNSLKGASIFNRRMIELQKQFATQLLTHRNPYTGLRYVEEPALVIQEITNENNLFYLANTQLMLPSYVEELKGLWNQWLLKQYDAREKLAAAWTGPDGRATLTTDEDPAANTVQMPLQFLYADSAKAGTDPLRSPVRLNAMTRFLYDLQTAYYQEMLPHLRGLGLRCPITGTNQDFSDASNRANAACDAMTRNNYWCHPDVHSKPFNRFRNLPMVGAVIHQAATPMANVASSTVAGKPMIVPEYNFPWPNEFRAECLPLMTAYGMLQDWDGLLFFAYSVKDDRLTYFGNACDPVRWGQMVTAALLFHDQAIAPARNSVEIGVSRVDTFAARPQRTSDTYSPYRILPYLSKVRTSYFDDAYAGTADLVIASGHSAQGDYSKAKRVIVFADSAAVDETGYTQDRGASAHALLPGLITQPLPSGLTGIAPASLPPDAEPLKVGDDTLGAATDRCIVFPSASQLTPGDNGQWLHGLILGGYRRWGMPGAAPLEEAGQVFRSDTGELVLDSRARRFTAIAPRARIVVGFFGKDAVPLGDVTVTCRTAFAAISLVCLDNATELSAARRVLLTAVARAENTGQAVIQTGKAEKSIDADTGAFLPQSNIAIAEFGRPPVRVEPVDADVRLPPDAGWRAYALDPQGCKARELPANTDADATVIPTQAAQSPWILLERLP